LNTVKSQILDQLANNYPKFLKSDLKKCLNLILNEITDSLAKNQNIEIRDFGTFKIKKTKSRIGRNPKNGMKVLIPEKKTIQWKMSKELFKLINEKISLNEEK
tara:strand:+ start:203 stop:511 length:309 start_codon:yes stop_codon:yes gene_type:complete